MNPVAAREASLAEYCAKFLPYAGSTSTRTMWKQIPEAKLCKLLSRALNCHNLQDTDIFSNSSLLPMKVVLIEACASVVTT